MIGELIGGALGAIGNILGNNQAQKIAEQNIALQREFATQGIRWKVADAKAAGIHPLYALGASTHSFSPVSVGYSSPLSPLADAAKSMGQDLSRAVDSTRTQEERIAARLRLENLQLQNDALRAETASKIARLGSSQVGPPFPSIQNQMIPGQPPTALVKVEPQEVTAVRPGLSDQMPAPLPSRQYVDEGDGRFSVTIPEKLGEPYEADVIGMLNWGINNQILPRFGINQRPPQWPGAPQTYNPLTGMYQPGSGSWWSDMFDAWRAKVEARRKYLREYKPVPAWRR